MPIIQGKQTKHLIESIFFCETACNATKKTRLFSNFSSCEFNIRYVGGTPF